MIESDGYNIIGYDGDKVSFEDSDGYKYEIHIHSYRGISKYNKFGNNPYNFENLKLYFQLERPDLILFQLNIIIAKSQ